MEKQRQAKNTGVGTLILQTEATPQDPSFVGSQRKRGEGLLPGQYLQQRAARSLSHPCSGSRQLAKTLRCY